MEHTSPGAHLAHGGLHKLACHRQLVEEYAEASSRLGSLHTGASFLPHSERDSLLRTHTVKLHCDESPENPGPSALTRGPDASSGVR